MLLLLVCCGQNGSTGKAPGTGSSEPARNPAEQAKQTEQADQAELPQRYTEEDLAALKNTEHFSNSAVEHIFMGSVNKKGAATGYHYEGIEGSPGEVVEGTRSTPDENGVYTGKVTVNGAAKTGNSGYSSFYPVYMTPQDVVDAINQAYENRTLLSGSLYAGLTDKGIEIDMALTDDGKIITAYPIME